MQTHDTTKDRVTADLIITGGRVHTVNARNDIAEVVAVASERILSLIATGVPVAGSFDAPLTYYTPLFGIEPALTRKPRAGWCL
jgi:predicted amidohydrolase YtcJ